MDFGVGVRYMISDAFSKIAFNLAVVSLCFFTMCLLVGCEADNAGAEISPDSSFSTDDATLLERMYVDMDGDGYDECVELYTSAQIAADGQMAWDTGHEWSLLVKKEDAGTFPVIDEWIQYGELQFWVVVFGQENTDDFAGKHAETCIYASVTSGSDFELLRIYWDNESASFKKESVLNPPNQWLVLHSNKYSIPNPSYVQSTVGTDLFVLPTIRHHSRRIFESAHPENFHPFA
jgi:hypothetical protein